MSKHYIDVLGQDCGLDTAVLPKAVDISRSTEKAGIWGINK